MYYKLAQVLQIRAIITNWRITTYTLSAHTCFDKWYLQLFQQIMCLIKTSKLLHYLKLEPSRKNEKDVEKYCKENELYSRRLCLVIKNMKKQENKSSDKVL